MRFNTLEGVIRIPHQKTNLFSYIATPEDALASGLGRLCIIVEIQSRERKSAALGPECIAVLKDSFYHSPSSDIEASLELACQKANQWAKDLDDVPVGTTKKISIALLALKNDFVVFSGVNQGKIHLVRHGKLMDLFPPTKETQKRPQKKLFSNLTSGLLEDNDILLLGSHSLFDYLSEAAFKNILSRQEPQSAAEYFSQELQKLNPTRGFEAMVLKIQRVAESTPREEEIEQGTESPMTLSSLEALKHKETQVDKFISPPLFQTAHQYLKTIPEAGRALTGALKRLLARLPGKGVQGPIRESTFPVDLPTRQRERTTPAAPPAAPPEAPTTPENPPQRTLTLPRSIPEISGRSWRGMIGNWMRRRRYLVVGGILIAAFLISIILRSSSISLFTPSGVTAVKEQITTSLENADAALIYDNRSAAKTEIMTAQELFRGLNEKQRAKEKAIADRIRGLQRKLFRIETPKLEVAAAFSVLTEAQKEPVVTEGVFAAKGSLYAYRSTPPALLEISLAKKTVTVQPLELPGNGSYLSAHAEDDRVLLTSAKTGSVISLKDKTLERIPLPDATRTGILYANRAYILTANSIVRFTKSGTPPAWKQSAWIEDGTVFSDASSMAIDGNIYVATERGVIKLSKGEKVDFTLEELDLSLAPELLFTNLDSQSLYLLDRSHARFVIVDKNSGTLKKQLDLSEIKTPISSFVVDETKKLIYFHTDNKIMRTSF